MWLTSNAVRDSSYRASVLVKHPRKRCARASSRRRIVNVIDVDLRFRKAVSNAQALLRALVVEIARNAQ
jgi:hypothetical protein